MTALCRNVVVFPGTLASMLVRNAVVMTVATVVSRAVAFKLIFTVALNRMTTPRLLPSLQVT